MGPIYKTTLSRKEMRWINILAPYPYSVTRVNQLVSLFVTAVWLALIAQSIEGWRPSCDPQSLKVAAILGTTVVAAVSLLGFTLGKRQLSRPKANFDRRTD